MYNKVPANMNFVEREKNIEKFWEDEQIFKKSIDSRKQGPITSRRLTINNFMFILPDRTSGIQAE